MPPPKQDLVTKDGLELRLVIITTALNDVTDQVFGNERRNIPSLVGRMKNVELVLDKYKFTIALATLVFNTVITLALATLEVIKLLHGTP